MNEPSEYVKCAAALVVEGRRQGRLVGINECVQKLAALGFSYTSHEVRALKALCANTEQVREKRDSEADARNLYRVYTEAAGPGSFCEWNALPASSQHGWRRVAEAKTR